MQNTQCVLCRKKTPFTILFNKNFSSKEIKRNTFSARRVPDKIHYRIVRCNKCGLVRSNPILGSKMISLLYKDSDITYQNLIFYLRRTYGFYLHKFSKYTATKELYLDIGCGNGFMLEEAEEQGFKRVFGVEPGKKAVQQGTVKNRKNIIVSLFKQGLFPDGYFDCITCFHALDHVVNPRGFLQNVYRILKPGGTCLIIVHNMDSLYAKILKSNCPIFDIEHIYLFNKYTLDHIFRQQSFKVIRIFDVINTYPLAYWIKMSPIPAKTRLLSLVTKFNLSNVPLTLPAGNIGIVARR